MISCHCSEEINSNGGFSVVKKLLDGNVRMKDWDAEVQAARNSCYSTSVIVRSTLGFIQHFMQSALLK